jgi:lysophospholipase L1-like esterase
LVAVSPLARRTLLWAAATIVVATVGGCGDEDDDDTAGGTLPLFGGTVPSGGPAIDLTPSPSGDGGREVVVIGDSITVASAPQIVAGAPGIDADVTVLAEVGRRIAVGQPPAPGTDVLAEVLADSDPDLVVVALGTNDVGKYDTIEEYAAQIEELVDLLPADQPLVWINTYLSGTPEGSAKFNAALLETLSDRGAASIGRWSSIAQRDGMLSDGVHPSEDGTQEFANLVLDEIENWLG